MSYLLVASLLPCLFQMSLFTKYGRMHWFGQTILLSIHSIWITRYVEVCEISINLLNTMNACRLCYGMLDYELNRCCFLSQTLNGGKRSNRERYHHHRHVASRYLRCKAIKNTRSYILWTIIDYTQSKQQYVYPHCPFVREYSVILCLSLRFRT